MNLAGLKLRWINYACYEIVLPNGKVIVVDPCIDTQRQSDFSADQFTGADYLLISHTHYDHTMELSYLEKKFHSKVFVGSMSAFAVADFFDINFDRLYPISPNERFELEDFTLEVFRSKHTFMNREDNVMSKKKAGISPTFPKGHALCDLYGSIEYLDFLITTRQNVRIFISGGGPHSFFYTNIFDTMKEKAPNIVIRQSSSKYTPEEFGRIMDRFHCQLALPLHQDGIERKTDLTIQQYVDRANAELARIGSFCRVVNPPQYRWLTLSMTIEEEA